MPAAPLATAPAPAVRAARRARCKDRRIPTPAQPNEGWYLETVVHARRAIGSMDVVLCEVWWRRPDGSVTRHTWDLHGEIAGYWAWNKTFTDQADAEHALVRALAGPSTGIVPQTEG